MKSWLYSVVGASMLSALAMALCPKGRVRAVTGFVCAMLSMLALLSPVMELDPQALSSSMAYWRQQAQTVVETEEETSHYQKRMFIEEQCRTYILDEARRLGLELSSVEVQAVWDEEKEIWYPRSVAVPAAFSPALSTVIEAELGIAKEEQNWNG